LDELRFPQSQIVQGFDERHQDNFVLRPAFANANQYFSLEKPLCPPVISGPILALRVQKSGVRLLRTPL